jgi:hypothetical protein
MIGCASGRPDAPPPESVGEEFFPITTGSWWEFETILPGFPDERLVDRFMVRPPDPNGRYPIFIRTLTINPGVPPGKLALQVQDGYVRMYRDGKPVDILRFGATVGETWAFRPDRPQYRAHLKDIRYEWVLGKWRPVAVVEMHAGGLGAEVVRSFWFARGVGWVRFIQKRTMGSKVRTHARDARIRPVARAG